ncbi:MAG: cold-shock protein [Bacteroidales bacterium]
MGRSRESFQKREVRNKKEKKRNLKEKKRQVRKEQDKKSSLEDMIAYVDEKGQITSTPPDPDKKDEINPEEIEVSVPKNDPSLEPDPIRLGTVTFFNHSKGFGFIRDQENGQSVFVHVNELLEDIREGDKVTFKTEQGQKGPAAVGVEKVK